MNDHAWTVHELLARLHAALSELPPPADRRVRRRPDLRVFRYYVARGLVDGPRTLRGRQGLYGRRQLQQLVAIRRLQAAGKTLAEIEAQLRDCSDEQLEALATTPTRTRPLPPAGRSVEIELAHGIRLQVDALEALGPGERRRLRRLAAPLLRRLTALRGRSEEKR